jgi:3-hydroxyacyl-CoA dehydrogenase
LAREVYYLVAEDVVSVTDVDKALCWGPGLRWGIMGQVLLNHLGGGQGGIEHFFAQFTGPMTAWWKVLGSPVLTPEVQKKLIDGVHAEAGSRSIDELEAKRDEILLGLLELRLHSERADGRDDDNEFLPWRPEAHAKAS